MTRKLYELTVYRHDAGSERQINGPLASHLDLDEPEIAHQMLLRLLADAARRDGAKAKDVWQYTMRVRPHGDRRDLFTYVVTPSQVENLSW